jgi:acid phosphatase family membrane protein YuiD
MGNGLVGFVALAAIALALQFLLQFVAGIFLFREALRVRRMLQEPAAKMNALLAEFETIVADARPQISKIAGDAADISAMARQQAQNVNSFTNDVVERLRANVVRADQVLTAAIGSAEAAGTRMRRTVLKPLNKVKALKHGIQVGFEVYRTGNHPEADAAHRYDY